jgi:hypothetical protein
VFTALSARLSLLVVMLPQDQPLTPDP